MGERTKRSKSLIGWRDNASNIPEIYLVITSFKEFSTKEQSSKKCECLINFKHNFLTYLRTTLDVE